VAIRAITEESTRVKTLVDEVNQGSREQARGIEQIGKAIAQMEQVTQKAAANAEESAAAAEQLNAQSEALKDVVAQLTAMVGSCEFGQKTPRQMSSGGQRAAAAQRPRSTSNRSGTLQSRLAAVVAGGKDAFPLAEDSTEF